MSCNLIEVEVLESGIQGLSAYEVYVQNGGELSEKEWLESLKGQDGADGYTPVKGTDYWNEDDVNEIKSYVDEQVGNIDLSSYATKDEIPDISNLAEKSEIPDISNLASKDEIPDVSDFITNDVDNLSNYELKSNTGSSLELNIDNSTYIMTINLKNSDGTVLSSETVDLPLETMVINANYDNATKEIVLTLKSGTTTRFSVADLVSGLVNTDDLNVLLATKQDVLTAGTNISIENGEISATDTTYDIATIDNAGLMSADDKKKLDTIGVKYLGKNVDFNTQDKALDLNELDVGIYMIMMTDYYSQFHLKATYKGNIIKGSIYGFSSDFPSIASPMYLYIEKKMSDELDSGAIVGYLMFDKLMNLGNNIFIGGQNRTIKVYSDSLSMSSSTDHTLRPILTSGDQTIGGKKTFNTLPESSLEPVNDDQFVNKKYVDDVINSAINETLGGEY